MKGLGLSKLERLSSCMLNKFCMDIKSKHEQNINCEYNKTLKYQLCNYNVVYIVYIMYNLTELAFFRSN